MVACYQKQTVLGQIWYLGEFWWQIVYLQRKCSDCVIPALFSELNHKKMNSQDRIRLARRQAGMSQAKLAEAIGVQRSAVSHWESPQGKNPSVDHLRAVAMVAGITFEWLATGRGKMQLSDDAKFDSVSAADAILVEDMLELRLVQSFREASPRTRIALVEIVEELTAKRLGRTRPKRPSLSGE